MEYSIIYFCLLLFVLITGFYIGRSSRKAKIEDLRHEISEFYLENQALTLKVQELEAKLEMKDSLAN